MRYVFIDAHGCECKRNESPEVINIPYNALVYTACESGTIMMGIVKADHPIKTIITNNDLDRWILDIITS